MKALIEQGEQAVPELKIPRLVDGLELYWYQRLGVLHALKIKNSANFSVPGSGKTWMGYSTFFMMKDVERYCRQTFGYWSQGCNQGMGDIEYERL